MVKQEQLKKLIGLAMYAVAFIMPATNIPQITKLFSSHNATGLSIQTWIMYLLFGAIPLFYAFVNNIKPLIISNILWTLVELIMIYGIIRFGVLSDKNDLGFLITINTIGKTLTGFGLICFSSALALFGEDLVTSSHKKGTA
ncbi:MAG: hypothetical protein WCO19_01200 [Candidatus Saccharibacteria bacterium]